LVKAQHKHPPTKSTPTPHVSMLGKAPGKAGGKAGGRVAESIHNGSHTAIQSYTAICAAWPPWAIVPIKVHKFAKHFA